MISTDELLIIKDFTELSDEEKNIVLKDISEAQYKDYRKLVLAGKNQLQKENESLDAGSFILTAIKKHLSSGSRPMLVRILNAKVPAYQFLTVAAMLTVVVWLIFADKNRQESPFVRNIYHSDTVFLPAVKQQTEQTAIACKSEKQEAKASIADVKVSKENKQQMPSNPDKTPENDFGFGLKINIDNFLNKQKNGERFSANKSLKKFIVAMN